VTVNEGNRPQTVHLSIDRNNAPYVITKPFHHTQEIVAESSEGIEITIDVIPNYKLEREIPGFGECVSVINPKKLPGRIEGKLKRAVANYLMAGSDPE
jgi:predicted DNA-binding transcriptional regulator YafY